MTEPQLDQLAHSILNERGIEEGERFIEHKIRSQECREQQKLWQDTRNAFYRIATRAEYSEIQG